MSQYAANTEVSVEKSRSEIERTLSRYGASKFGYGRDDTRGIASIQFEANNRHVRFVLTLPSKNNEEFRWTPSRRKVRSPEQREKAWEQACRQRWRALALCVKAKLEAVEAGISEFEQEFMAHIVLPGGRTVGEVMSPQIEHAYDTGDMPPGIAGMLPAPTETE